MFDFEQPAACWKYFFSRNPTFRFKILKKRTSEQKFINRTLFPANYAESDGEVRLGDFRWWNDPIFNYVSRLCLEIRTNPSKCFYPGSFFYFTDVFKLRLFWYSSMHSSKCILLKYLSYKLLPIWRVRRSLRPRIERFWQFGFESNFL